MGTTIYDRTTVVAKQLGYDIALNPNIPTHGAVLGDISLAVMDEVKKKYPDYVFPPKVPTIVTSSGSIKTRIYPLYMAGLMDEVARRFIVEKKPFDAAGDVRPYRPVGPKVKEQKRRAYYSRVLGEPVSETFSLYVPGSPRPLTITRSARFPPQPSFPSPDVQSASQFPSLKVTKKRRQAPTSASSAKE